MGDKAFRVLINLVFSFLKPDKGQLIQINIDYTSERDNFLILMASTPFIGRSFPLYFSIRRYAKKKSRFDQKKMELAFLNELKHLLPKKKYEYLLVLDRGFACPRLIKLIQDLGFKYLIRTNDNWKIELEEQARLISQLPKVPSKDKTTLVNSKIKTTLVRNFESSGEWFLFTNLEKELPEIVNHYKQRFQIEKTFQDQKSSGFDMEETKISDYSRFKKLFFLTCFAEVLTMCVGDFLDKQLTSVKKTLHTQKKDFKYIQTSSKSLYLVPKSFCQSFIRGSRY